MLAEDKAIKGVTWRLPGLPTQKSSGASDTRKRPRPHTPLCMTPSCHCLMGLSLISPHCAGQKSSRGSQADIKPSHCKPGLSPSTGLNEAINPRAGRRVGQAQHMSRRPDRGWPRWLAVTERPDTPSLIPHAQPPPPGQQPIHLLRGFQVQPQASLLSVKMSPAHADSSYLSSCLSPCGHHSEGWPVF